MVIALGPSEMLRMMSELASMELPDAGTVPMAVPLGMVSCCSRLSCGLKPALYSLCRASDSVRDVTVGTSTLVACGGAWFMRLYSHRPPPASTSSVRTTSVAIQVRRRDFWRGVCSRSTGSARGRLPVSAVP